MKATSGTITVGWYYGDPDKERQRRPLQVTGRLELHAAPMTDIHHQPIAEVLRLAIQGEFDGGAGQIVMSAENWVPLITHWAKGWDAERLGTLLGMWERWHLNDMRAACVHQAQHESMAVAVGDLPEPFKSEARGYPDLIGYRMANVPPCQGTDPAYRYGSAWLVEQLTPEAIEWATTTFGIEVPS